MTWIWNEAKRSVVLFFRPFVAVIWMLFRRPPR